MVRKKNEHSINGYLDVENLQELADGIIALEEKNLKKWTKKHSKAKGFIQPRIERGQDLEGLIRARFQGIGDEVFEIAMWVDLYINTRDSLFSDVDGEYSVLMNTNEAVEALMIYEKNHPDEFDFVKEWVGSFGCLLVDGRQSFIGGWFTDWFSESLFTIGALGQK